MLVRAKDWPPFLPNEYVQDMPDEIKNILPALHALYVMLNSSVYDQAILHYFKTNREFNDKIRKSHLSPIVNQLDISITKSLVISMSDIFDRDRRTINIRRLLKVALEEQWISILQPRHKLRGEDIIERRCRLIRMQRRLKQDPVNGAISRIINFRNKGVAHIELITGDSVEIPKYGDIRIALVAAANICDSLLRYLTHRRICTDVLHKRACEQAEMLGKSIHPLEMAAGP